MRFFKLLLAVSFAVGISQLYCVNRAFPEDLLSRFRPREIGPTVFGGRIVDIEVDSLNSHRIFVAAASGGLWLTENNGTTWQNIFDDQPTISIGDIAVDANDSRVVWVGTGEANNQRSSFWGNGIYKSTDRGKTWNHVGLTDSHHIARIVIDPQNSDTVYVAALGHLYSPNDERGLFKTTDGGKTWEKILYINNRVGVVDLVVDPSNPKILFAATYERIRRAWNFDGAGPGSAIYKTTDGGKSWKKMTRGLPAGEIGRIGLALYPGDPQIIYATVSNQNLTESRDNAGKKMPPAEPSKAENKTANNQFPTPFDFSIERNEKGFFITGLATSHPARRSGLNNRAQIVSLGGISANEPKRLIAMIGNLKSTDRVSLVVTAEKDELEIIVTAPPLPGPRQVGGEVYRSDNGGESWKKVNQEPVGGTPAYYYGQIRVDPRDSNRLYILSVPLLSSTDGGKSWNAISRSVHVDHHALWINPQAPNHIMLGNDGGFHQSFDYGKTMDHYFNLPLAQFYAVAIDMQDPYHVYGGTQDNGSWGGPAKSRQDGRGRGISPLHWYRIGGGDGFYVQVDPKDPNLYLAESQFGAIFRGDRLTGDRKSIRPQPQNPMERYRFNWNSPILMSKFDSRVIYFGGNKLFKSMNQGDDWSEISGDLTTANHEKISGNVPHCTITTIAESAMDRKLLMVGTDDGKVQVTQDGGETWTDLSGNFPYRPKEWWCSRVELSHHERQIAYASFTGYREDDFRSFLFQTEDSGATWTSITGNLPQEPINVIKEDQKNPNLLYVGTEFGCYLSMDRGTSWTRLPGIPRVSVQDLVVHPRENDLILGTHGRGFFVVDDVTPLQQMAKDNGLAIQLFQPRAIKSGASALVPRLSGDRHFRGADPKEAGKLWYRVKTDSDQQFKISVFDENDKPVFSKSFSNKPGLHYLPISRGQSRSSRGGRTRGNTSAAENENPVLRITQKGIYSVILESSNGQAKQSAKLIVQ